VFKPTILVTQHGCDSHRLDPLAHLALTVDGQRRAQLMLHELAHELCGGRWVATGGGGYALVQVVPRTWTHLLGVAAGAPVEPETATPEQWRELAKSIAGETAPLTMTDGASAEYVPFAYGADPGDPVDRAILRTRSAVFPSHGLAAMLNFASGRPLVVVGGSQHLRTLLCRLTCFFMFHSGNRLRVVRCAGLLPAEE
jgi:acetoin utilization protein AcuC